MLGPPTSINNQETSPQVSMTGVALHGRRSTQVALIGVKLTVKATYGKSITADDTKFLRVVTKWLVTLLTVYSILEDPHCPELHQG